MSKSHCLKLISVFALTVSVASGYDGDKSASNKPAKPTKDSPKSPITAEMEAETVQFVRQHHEKLVELLTQLKTNDPTHYEQAVRELSRAATTLAETEKRDPKKYVLDLRAWQVNSQIQVLAARLAMSPTPELKEELRARLIEQIDIRIEQQKLDRERTEARLKKLDESITKLEGSREQEAVRAFEKLSRSTPKPGSKKQKETKAAKTNSKEAAVPKTGGTPK